MIRKIVLLLSIVFTTQRSDIIYDRNNKILCAYIHKYSMEIYLNNIYNKKNFLLNLQKVPLSLNKNEFHKIYEGISNNNIFYEHKSLISLYDKMLLKQSGFFNRNVFNFIPKRVFDYQTKQIKMILTEASDVPCKVSLFLYAQKDLEKLMQSGNFSIIINSRTGEIYALSGNKSYLYSFVDFDELQSFFYTVYMYNNHYKTIASKKSYVLFDWVHQIAFQNFIKQRYSIEFNVLLNHLSHKINNPTVFNKNKYDYTQYSDVERLNMYMMHFIQILQIISNDGAISQLGLNYVKKNAIISSEKMLYDFDSDEFFALFDNYINVNNKHIIYKQNDLLFYMYNATGQKVSKKQINKVIKKIQKNNY